MAFAKILPGTGSGTSGAAGGGGGSPQAVRRPNSPSATLRLIPLRAPGRM